MTPADHETEGWVLVPEEPTCEMWAAAGDAVVRLQSLGVSHHDKLIEASWTALIDAAPTPPAPSLPAGAADPVAGLLEKLAPHAALLLDYQEDGLRRQREAVESFSPAQIAQEPNKYIRRALEVNAAIRTEALAADEALAALLRALSSEAERGSPSAASAGNPATDHVDLSPTTAGSAEGVKLDLSASPFAETGIGGLMFSGAHAYRAEYVLSTEGDDHQPTEFEAWLLEDFVAGLMSDERFFGPVRALLALASPAPTQTGEG